ncbi:hypothetical protein IQ07DRAFT_38303 [Pyrenochaeta sp. DS3sAY3a]|nr:hypothetical protein IQ07DRAFT_38303 [Pyrenochaeta sp. DS3sAY3a]
MRDNDKEKNTKRNRKTAAPATPQSAYKAANAVQTPNSSFVCKSEGCGKSFTSEAAFKNHQADIHGVGGKALDLHGKDQYILSPHMRQQLKNAGVLQASTNSPLARGEGRGTGRGSGLASSFDLHGPSTTLHPGRVTATGPMPSPFHNAAQDASSTPGKQTAKTSTSARQPLPVVSTFAEFAAIPVKQPTPGTPEIEEAKDIQVKTLPLRMQSNIFIYHDGKIFVDGKNWSRIEISKQQEVITRLNEMCGLQRYMRGEDTPVPNAFKDLYTAEYPSSDFEESPKRDPAKPGVPVVALWCSKVVLATGHEDLVKISAVDLAKGRVLINHFVCTDPTANVNDWCSKTTRLANWSDMERARQHDFKIFSGWAAARTALWQFVDKDTLIVGHNLRSDFDALRMTHGRALDIVLIAEQVAEGPLSKAQLTLHRMVRTFCNVDIDYYRKIGQQDCPTNAFAVRELALFVVKNRRLFDENFRLRSRDYQKILSAASG